LNVEGFLSVLFRGNDLVPLFFPRSTVDQISSPRPVVRSDGFRPGNPHTGYGSPPFVLFPTPTGFPPDTFVFPFFWLFFATKAFLWLLTKAGIVFLFGSVRTCGMLFQHPPQFAKICLVFLCGPREPALFRHSEYSPPGSSPLHPSGSLGPGFLFLWRPWFFFFVCVFPPLFFFSLGCHEFYELGWHGPGFNPFFPFFSFACPFFRPPPRVCFFFPK